MALISPNGDKTPWEKEKLLITSNFSFSHNVFKRLVLQTLKNQGMFGKLLKEHYTKQVITSSCLLKIHSNNTGLTMK